MSLTVVKPRRTDTAKGNVILLAGPVGTTRGVIFKIRDFDPSKHPRGYKGLFVDTPDKIAIKDSAPGDVVATKSGRVFKVEGHGGKGTRVQSVDPDTGEVLAKSTVIAHGIEVARVEGGKGFGTRHPIGDLPEGTFIQHPKSGKRFLISKHGSWTTVYPVDNNGEVAGKHTVLPKTTEVIVGSKSTSGPVTQATVNQVQKATPTPPKMYADAAVGDWVHNPHTKTDFEIVGEQDADTWLVQARGAGSLAPVVPLAKSAAAMRWGKYDGTPKAPAPPKQANNNTLGLKIGDSVKGKNTGAVYEVTKISSTGWPIAVDDQGETFKVDPAIYEKHIEEVLPTNLKRPPRPYAAGVGSHTGIVIDEIPEPYPSGNRMLGKPTYQVSRLLNGSNPNGGGTILGTFDTIGRARKAARDMGEAHEVIHESKVKTPTRVEEGDWIAYQGRLQRVERVEDYTHWGGYGSSYRPQHLQRAFLEDGSSYGQVLYPHYWMPVADIADLRQFSWDNGHGHLDKGAFLHRDVVEKNLEEWAEHKTVRAARPNLYLPQLQSDWKPDDLLGKSKGDALKALRKLGYGEVLPREPNMAKYVNASGARLHVHNKNGVITAVDEVQTQSTRGGGKGFHQQLKAVLDSGGDVRSLDPSASPYEEEHNSHSRQILYDMALGKQNGVEKVFGKGGGGTIKVKADAAYHTEIRQDTSWLATHGPNAQKANVTDPGVNIPVVPRVMEEKWGIPQSAGNSAHTDHHGVEHATAAIAVGERNGVAQTLKDAGAASYIDAADMLGEAYKNWKAGTSFGAGGPFDAISTDPGTRQYLLDALQDIEPRAKRQIDFRDSEIARRAEALYQQDLQAETSRRRAVEGTVASLLGGTDTFELPLWDEIEMEDQDIWAVESLIQNAPKNAQTPFFVTGGIVKDGVLAGVTRNYEKVIEARVPQEFDTTAVQRMGVAQRMTNSRQPVPGQSYSSISGAGYMLSLDDGSGKRIEYVPHGNGPQEAATNQRGRLSLYGYSPDEAITRLKDLGFIHELEEEVPFSSVFRAKRRYGVVTPLHSDYVSGEAPLPRIPTAITHGISSYTFDPVLDSGGLLPIAERYRVGIPLNGTIPGNDIRNGVDHVTFAAMHGEYYQNYGDASVIMKDSAYLRRDILLTDRAFGTGNSRYPMYRKYQNRFRAQAGEKDHDVNIYKTLSPKARQLHIDNRVSAAGRPTGLSASNNEWDIAGGVPIEDMAVIVVPNQSTKDNVDRKLDRMLAAGSISERPVVQVGGLENVIRRDWKSR